jgi:hypothetical protein
MLRAAAPGAALVLGVLSVVARRAYGVAQCTALARM